MSETIDASVLLYASDEQSARQPSAQRLLQRLVTGPDLIYLFWPVATAYLRIATHPRISERPLDDATAPIQPALSSIDRTCAGPANATGSGSCSRTLSMATS